MYLLTMPYSIVATDAGTHLFCVSDGEVSSADELFAWALDVVAKSDETGQKKMLLDNRTFRLKLTALDVVTFAEMLEKLGGAQLGLRFSVLPCPKNKDVSRMMETTLTNRSASYKIHSSLEESKKWLDV